MTVSPMLEIKIVKEGTARRDHNTKNALPLFEYGEKSISTVSYKLVFARKLTHLHIRL